MVISNDVIRTAIVEATQETFENMAFLDAVILDSKGMPDFDAKVLWASIPLTAPINGKMWLILPEKDAEKIVSSLYPVDDKDLTKEMVSDVIAEFVNTISGRCMGLIDENVNSGVGLPSKGEDCPCLHSDSILCCFLFDDTDEMVVAVELESE